jgi:hypothetical protein
VYKDYVDLAAEMGWQILILDEGWQQRAGAGMAYSGGFGYVGFRDYIPELLAHANSKNIDLHVWFHYYDLIWKNNTHSRLGEKMTYEEVKANLKQYADMGFKGIKSDFFQSDSQSTRQDMDMIHRACAELKLMINHHGNELWPGVRRTWPHIVTQEAVGGEEQHLFNYNRIMDQITILPYVRNAVGPMDFTPSVAYFHTANNALDRARTIAKSLAMAVIFESGVQTLADREVAYRTLSIRPFFKTYLLLGTNPFSLMGHRQNLQLQPEKRAICGMWVP